MKRNSPASSARRYSTVDIEQLRQMTKAARMHHIQGARQTEIAERMGISQAGVSRLLRMAEEHGIIRNIVVPPEGLYPDLEDGLIDAYALDAVYVVDMGSAEDGIAQILGAAAAQCLNGELKGGPTLGFTSWSTTLREMARLIEPRLAADVKSVVETLGDLGSPMLQHEADVATLHIAQAFDAEAVFLRAPGVMPSRELRDAALADAHVRKALRLLDDVDIVLVGIGPADFHGPLAESDNFFTSQQLAEVRAAGAVGQLHQRFIDREGRPVQTPLDDLVIGITLDQLRNAGRRIAVAGGEKKHDALAAALAGEWIDVLVTDVNSANYLLAAASGPRTKAKG
ncbi:MAG: winged helix-turn-helix transcriptional regulator [Alphaproteobacteria bacterium]|nr:winged helix-turn-helix transcriptional regulator [Alphaproteobacteria bacterium]